MQARNRWFRLTSLSLLLVAAFGTLQAAQIRPVEEDEEGEEPFFVKGVNVRFHPRANRGLAAGTRGASDDVRRGGMTRGDGRPRVAVQVNDPTLDNILVFAGTRPFEFATNSEVSLASYGRNIVVGYNSSADVGIVNIGGALFFDHVHLSGYSVSNDGGLTWTSGFIPPAPGSLETDGDPALGVDRAGNFYYASLGTDADGNFGIIVSKSTDGGRTFAPAVVAASDDGSDKEWLAIGPDPFARGRDNVYVTYTSFNDTGSELRLLKSIDGGATWSTKTLFAPVDDGVMSGAIQFSNPVVDASTGRLYIPFLHFSNLDADLVRVLVSDDGGGTFRLLRFDVAGAPDAFGFPNVTPGPLTDCGSPGGGVRQVLHQGANLGGGRFGLPRYRQATRLITQPSAAAANGRLFIAINGSTSPAFGDPNAGSRIRLLASGDGGRSWSVSTIAPATTADPNHINPSVATDNEGESVQVGYYTQQGDEKMRVDLWTGEFDHGRVKAKGVRPLKAPFDLAPTNNPIPSAAQPFRTTNFDRLIQPCYNLGEYMSVAWSRGGTRAAFGANPNLWTSPPGSPLFTTPLSTHAQPDVFFTQGADD